MSLTSYLSLNHIIDFEGHSGQIKEQTDRLIELCNQTHPKRVLEIGFNVGHSADTFLSHSLAHVTSFDIDKRESVQVGKQYIDTKYPTRHTLITGDSTLMIPRFIEENDGITFDLIFIDGGHTEEIAYKDLMNCKKLSHRDTIVVMDDVVMRSDIQREWSLGPSKVWANAMLNRVVQNIEYECYAPGRGMAWGYYI